MKKPEILGGQTCKQDGSLADMSARELRLMLEEVVQDHFDKRIENSEEEESDRQARIAWVRSKIKQEEQYSRMRNKIIESAAIWVVLLALGFLGYALWHEVVGRIGIEHAANR
jgi:hypothetical protein